MFPNHWTKPKDDGPSKVNVRKIKLDELTELCQDPRNLIFTIHHELEATLTKAARDNNQMVPEEDKSMEGIPTEYSEFRDVFLGQETDRLLPH